MSRVEGAHGGDGSMRAAVYHGPGDVRVEDVPRPGPPGPGELLLRVTRAALCGTDASEYSHGPHQIPLTAPHPGSGHVGPVILGHELSGVVEAIGGSAVGFAAGDRVVPGAGMWCENCAWCRAGRTNLCRAYYTLGLQAHGGLAGWVTVPERMCHPLPDACDDTDGALAQPMSVALHAITRAGVDEGDSVALVGVGGIGLFLLAGLVHVGATVTAVDLSDERLARAGRVGASTTVQASAAVADDLRPHGDGFDVVFEASGAAAALPLAQALVRRGGRLALVGIHANPRPVDLADLVVREVDVSTSNAHVCGRDLPRALDIIARGDLAAEAVDRVVPLDAVVSEGLEPLAHGTVSGKVIVDLAM